MLTQEQITNFWNQISSGELVDDGYKIIVNDDVEQVVCIRIADGENEHYSRKNANFSWELTKDVGESSFV